MQASFAFFRSLGASRIIAMGAVTIDAARAAGFEGRLVVIAEPDIALGDCRIEWADGGVNRDSVKTEAAIADMVRRYVTARAPDVADAPVGPILK